MFWSDFGYTKVQEVQAIINQAVQFCKMKNTILNHFNSHIYKFHVFTHKKVSECVVEFDLCCWIQFFFLRAALMVNYIDNITAVIQYDDDFDVKVRLFHLDADRHQEYFQQN